MEPKFHKSELPYHKYEASDFVEDQRPESTGRGAELHDDMFTDEFLQGVRVCVQSRSSFNLNLYLFLHFECVLYHDKVVLSRVSKTVPRLRNMLEFRCSVSRFFCCSFSTTTAIHDLSIVVIQSLSISTFTTKTPFVVAGFIRSLCLSRLFSLRRSIRIGQARDFHLYFSTVFSI
jgi:hypothetical protein